MSRCTVCRLDPERRSAVDAVLRDGQISFQELSRRCGFSKSALHRHRQHMDTLDGPTPARLSLAAPIPAPVPAPALTHQAGAPAALAIGGDPTAGAAAAKPGREQLLSRIELLWGEALSGLEAAKEPIRIEKPDGSIVEMPGDLRARSGFIREGRQVLELQAAVTGNLGVAGTSIMIVLPTALGAAVSAVGELGEVTSVIDIARSGR
jgi:hypothetical protein